MPCRRFSEAAGAGAGAGAAGAGAGAGAELQAITKANTSTTLKPIILLFNMLDTSYIPAS